MLQILIMHVICKSFPRFELLFVNPQYTIDINHSIQLRYVALTSEKSNSKLIQNPTKQTNEEAGAELQFCSLCR